MQPVRIGLIGYGYWGKILARYLDESISFDLKYIFGRSLEREGRYTNQLGALLCRDDIGAVIVATPIPTHYEIVKGALECGKHVFCEKPLVMRTDEAVELKELAAAKCLSLAVDFTYTFSPALWMAQYYLKLGRIGALQRVEILIKKVGVFAAGDVRWVLGPHALSILDMFCSLDSLSFRGANHMSTGSRVESTSITFAGASVAGCIDLSMNYPAKQMEVVLYGEEGTIIYRPNGTDGWTLRLLQYPRSGDIPTKALLQSSVDTLTDEGNNLRYAVLYFTNILNRKIQSNITTAVEVTNILGQLEQQNCCREGLNECCR